MDDLFTIENNTIKINEGERRTGKDEMNLIELPFSLLTKKQPKDIKTIERNWLGKGEDGKERKFYKIITGSDKWGLPTFIGEEVYLACMELSYRQGFKSRKVHATQYELLKIMGWPLNDGRSYERLIRALSQLSGILITTNAFWDNQDKEYKKRGFGIIGGFAFSEKEKRRKRGKYHQLSLPLGHFYWDDTFYNESLKKGNIKTLDTVLYFSLNHPTTKRLYRFADKKLYNQESFELDLFRLAFEKMEMIGNYKYPSEIIRKLTPAITELKEKSIVDITFKKSHTESGHKVCFKLPKKPKKIAETTPVEEKKTVGMDSPSAKLVGYFQQQLGSQEGKRDPIDKELQQAQILLAEHGEEKSRAIVDYAIKQAPKTNFKMRYFGAILSYAEEALDILGQEIIKPVPGDTVINHEDEEAKLQMKYSVYQEKILADFKSSLTPEELKALFTKIENYYLKKFPQMRQWAQGDKNDKKAFRSTIEANFNDWLVEQGKIEVLEFEQWKYSNKADVD